MPNVPRYDRLAREGLLTVPTLTALARRAEVLDGEPRFLSPEEFTTLTALCETLRPPYERPIAREIALRIDARLADDAGDGWRYEELPPFRETYRKGLAALLAEGTLDASRVQALWRNQGQADWPFSSRRFVEEVLAAVATHAYSHPVGQDAIGYVGFADNRGWQRIGLNERETWE